MRGQPPAWPGCPGSPALGLSACLGLSVSLLLAEVSAGLGENCTAADNKEGAGSGGEDGTPVLQVRLSRILASKFVGGPSFTSVFFCFVLFCCF